MTDSEDYSPVSGDLIGADGNVYNLVELLGGESADEMVLNPETFSPRSGKVIGADGGLYDLPTLIQNARNGALSVSGDQTLTDAQKQRVLRNLGIGEYVEKYGDNLALSAEWDYGHYYGGTGEYKALANFSCTRIGVSPGDTINFSGFIASDNEASASFSTAARMQFWNQLEFVSAPVVAAGSQSMREYSVPVPEGVDSATFAVWFSTLADIQANTVIRVKHGTVEIKVDSANVTPVNLKGKRWTSYGDSITYKNGWQPYLVAKYGLTHTNLGIGSTCVAQHGTNSMCADARLQAVKDANPDVVTILGGANDLVYADAGGISLGDASQLALPLAEKSLTTFYGAYSYIVETLLTWKPTLRIIILGMYYAHANGTAYSETVTYTDFSEAARVVAAYYSLPFVDLHGESGFSAFTMGTGANAVYATDKIHPNDMGCVRIAECVDAAFSRLFLYE